MPYRILQCLQAPVALRRVALDCCGLDVVCGPEHSVLNDCSDSSGPEAGVVPTVSRAGCCPVSGAVPVPGCRNQQDPLPILGPKTVNALLTVACCMLSELGPVAG